ncbi:hypothetical protein [Pseudoalteromonas luteoviolacea]|uniref:hypothetical protein n=1 Tax=Pseudoalteromonas luteoviolacea TaxID=43657 RepID=UPI00114F74B2|nr:hypothetical protein [Pseudoalteromonas luteoviolacea]TQF69575.1 hypothetical protein FLM44_00210 [Pseudoalteromonas luteoviolacea]
MLNSEYAPNCDAALMLVAAIKRAIDSSSHSRPSIVDRMNEAIGGTKTITIDMLNKWVSAGSDRKMPAEYLTAFCWATQSTLPFEVLLQPIEFMPVDGRGVSLQRAAEMILQATQLQRQAEGMLVEITDQNRANQVTPTQP